MKITKNNKKDSETNSNSQLETSKLKSLVFYLLMVIVGVLFFLAGAIVESFVKQNVPSMPEWLKSLLTFPIPLAGVTILSHFVPLAINWRGKPKQEEEKIEREAEKIAEKVKLKLEQTCNNCMVVENIKDNSRWCRWLGPISDVYKTRDTIPLVEFFNGVKEIDILTPNLWEIAENDDVMKILQENDNVRLMSLHPECSSVYRRYNDMLDEQGRPPKDIKDRKDYQRKIRMGLDNFHGCRKDNKKNNWLIKTYTSYPVIMLYRADNRFLLSFPLKGNRVKYQFHLDLKLPDRTLETLEKLKGKKGEDIIPPDMELGAKVQNDLKCHFDGILKEEKTIPWIPRAEIFEKILALNHPSIINLNNCINNRNITNNKSLIKNNNQALKDLINKDISNLTEEYKLDEKTKSAIIENLLKILVCIEETVLEGDNINNKLIQKLSDNISTDKFEFEDCAEVLYILRKKNNAIIPFNFNQIWENIKNHAAEWAG
ncbi:MAG: hypothetical protein HY934_04875 [Candidatus Firestonebacteria bacterium]|nr:hypothetical protein [Candidatus Firestonebacteria bacterium]